MSRNLYTASSIAAAIGAIAANDPSHKGERASRKVLFGEFNRYAVAALHTRFDAVTFFVWDAHLDDGTGRPEVIRQEDTLEAALAGLAQAGE